MAAFFNLEQLHAVAEDIRNTYKSRPRKIRVKYCGNCKAERECVYLFYRDVPDEYVGSRICLTCGFSPGTNKGVRDKKLRQAVLDADNHECVYCGSTERLALDHIVPHSRGGETTFSNLLTTCHSCNSRRHTKRTPVVRYGRFRKQY